MQKILKEVAIKSCWGGQAQFFDDEIVKSAMNYKIEVSELLLLDLTWTIKGYLLVQWQT